MNVILGVDGGQSSTQAVLATNEGQVLAVGHGGPANHLHEPGGLERLERSLRTAVTTAIEGAGLSGMAVVSACFGMTGGWDLVPALVNKFLHVERIGAYHDVVTALAGASAGQPGVVVIAGTGAIVYGRTEDGREARADGWGYLMGDEGSGYWIGIQALQAAARAADARGPATRLQQDLPRALGKPDLHGVHEALYSYRLTRPEIAGLSHAVYCAAEAGDAVARELLKEAGKRLARSAFAVIRKLELRQSSVYKTGGVFRAGHWVEDSFAGELQSSELVVHIQPPAFPQVVGALIMAFQQLGNAISPAFLDQLQASLPDDLARKVASQPCV